MRATSSKRHPLFVVAGGVLVLTATTALAGGNGNGGNGSGGAHGAATSGMTYHSEPVNSPWNRPVGTVAKNDGRATPDATPPARQEAWASKDKSVQ